MTYRRDLRLRLPTRPGPRNTHGDRIVYRILRDRTRGPDVWYKKEKDKDCRSFHRPRIIHRSLKIMWSTFFVLTFRILLFSFSNLLFRKRLESLVPSRFNGVFRFHWSHTEKNPLGGSVSIHKRSDGSR